MEKSGNSSMGQWLTALVIGLCAAVGIWIITPFNNFVLRNTFISDGYLPFVVLLILFVLVLLVNPILKLISPSLVLTRAQLGLILGILLMASVPPGQGLFRGLPWSIARETIWANQRLKASEIYEEIELPPSLFPDELGYEKEAPASETMMDELHPGESIPWGAWLGPLLSWGSLILFIWLLMVGLALIVLPQWKNNERLPFPLVNVYDEFINTSGNGSAIPPLFKQKLFWLAAGIVFLLHLTSAGNTYLRGSVPVFPLSWNLSSCFTEGAWRYLPGFMKSGKIYFVVVGMAFFMPSRVGFSIWFIMVAYGIYWMLGSAYAPPFESKTIGDHRTGAMISMTIGILWLGRKHWAHVLRCTFRKSKTDSDFRDASAGRMFLLGCAGVFTWFIWAGVPAGWSLVFVLCGFMVCLLITRLLCETGLPSLRIYDGLPIYFMRLMPAPMLAAAAIFMSGVVELLFQYASRVSATAMAVHALAVNRPTPRRQVRLVKLFMIVLVLGLIIAGASHLWIGYNYSSSLDGKVMPLNSLGCRQLENAVWAMVEWSDGSWFKPGYNRIGHLSFGIVVAALLQWACLAAPKWPLHPIGFLLVGKYFGIEAWWSVLFGWLIKMLLIHYGGAKAFRSCKGLFLVVILGDVLTSLLLMSVGFFMVLLDRP